MRMHRSRPPFDDSVVDLDNPQTYDYLPQTTKELRARMFEHIGFVYCYMNIWHNDTFGYDHRDGGQKKRVLQMIEDFAKNENPNYENLMWYQEQVFLFEEEIENMC